MFFFKHTPALLIHTNEDYNGMHTASKEQRKN